MKTVPACEFEHDVMSAVLCRQPDSAGKDSWLGGTVESLLVIFRGGLPHPYYRVRTVSHSSYNGRSESVIDYPAGEVIARPAAAMLQEAKPAKALS